MVACCGSVVPAQSILLMIFSRTQIGVWQVFISNNQLWSSSQHNFISLEVYNVVLRWPQTALMISPTTLRLSYKYPLSLELGSLLYRRISQHWLNHKLLSEWEDKEMEELISPVSRAWSRTPQCPATSCWRSCSGRTPLAEPAIVTTVTTLCQLFNERRKWLIFPLTRAWYY